MCPIRRSAAAIADSIVAPIARLLGHVVFIEADDRGFFDLETKVHSNDREYWGLGLHAIVSRKD